MGSTPLIGRDRELALADELLGQVTAGRPHVLLLQGPRGSGRTRLGAEIAGRARERGITVNGPEPGAGPVLVVVAARRGSDPALLDRWGAAVVHRITLEPLSAADVERLAAAVLGTPPGPELLDLLPIAAGRPGLVKRLAGGPSGPACANGIRADAAAALAGRTEAVVGEDLATLSPPARHLVQAATSISGPFALLRLTRLLGVSPVAVLPAVEEVLDAGLLATDGELLSFRHERVREIVAASLPQPVAAALRTLDPAVDWSVLSPREREVAELAGRALTNVQIAHRVGRSPHTVNYHLRQIFQKLGIASRVELAALLEHGRARSGMSRSSS
ncbi:LuxR C-terminal-related transcriptional regulator [Actinoplanes sp. N902-109]|uniref:helix-turn-helix transcriptional regulator n=1 Tax=Actinoplanes sp. (strain N902-109) TaxID=649831 RepID=UPI00032959E2|nr:LuxR C-terminal-related transcriptional regulator [Actinoplanes sp. N902-109]AGL18882.1 hypothetical protein L083_5372 [Actinoplanes sp. N902-109]